MALVLAPLVWLISLPFRLIGITFDAVFALIKAVLFLPHSMTEGDEIWFSKSQLIDFDDDAELEEIESLVMSLWIARKKGLTEPK